MKLRFRENSLRLRVNRPEVENLAAGAALQEQVSFPGSGRFCYVLEPSQEAAPSASFRDGVLRISAPYGQMKRWARSDEIGLYFQLSADGTPLEVAIEKDLECIDGPPEERDPFAFQRSSTGKNC